MTEKDCDNAKYSKNRRGVYDDDGNHKSLSPPLRDEQGGGSEDVAFNAPNEETDVEESHAAGALVESDEQATNRENLQMPADNQFEENANDSTETPFMGVLVQSRQDKAREKLASNTLDAIDVRRDTSDERNRKRKIYVYCFILLIVVAVSIVVAFLGISRRSSNNDESKIVQVSALPSIPPSTIPTQTPSLAPTVFPSILPSVSLAPSSQRFGQVLSAIEYTYGELYYATFLDDLEDKSSPQYKAVQWLADEDVFVQFPFDLSYQLYEFSQRYAAVVLYYATGGEDAWIDQCNFLSPGHICEWNCPPLPGNAAQYFDFVQSQGISFCVDTGADSLGYVTTVVHMAGNNMTGTLPTEIYGFLTLSVLSFPANNLFGTLPLAMYDLTQLGILWLPFNQFSGTIDPNIGKLTSLELLWIEGNLLTGAIPSEIGLQSDLNSLNLSNNFLNGTFSEEVGALRNLDLLSISKNAMSGNVPESLYQLANLRTLSLSFNADFVWTLPDDLGNIYPNMERLSLSGVSINRSMPDSMVTMSNLNLLDLSYCELSATIPTLFVQLSKLEALDVGGNSLTGRIPSDLGNLSSLYTLDLSYNQLVGTLPSSLGSASNMYIFTVTSNALSGTIPQSYASWTNLGTMDFVCDAVP